MSLKKYLILMLFATAVCWLAFGMIIYFVDPDRAGILGFSLFYLSLLLSLCGILALLVLLARSRFSEDPAYRQVSTSFRQAVWFSLLITFFLFLQGMRVLKWWNLILFILFLAGLEFFFISHKRRPAGPEA